jgi:hypothetical protein
MPIKSVGGGDPVLVYGKPAYSGRAAPFLLANTSTSTTVYYGEDLTLTTGLSSQIPPLGSVALDGTGDVWASTLIPGTTAALDVIPGGTGWAASPSQIALEIAESGLALNSTLLTTNTTVAGVTTAVGGVPAGIAVAGVPLLTKSTAVDTDTVGAVAAGGTVTRGPFTIGQIGYEISISVKDNAPGTVPLFRADLTWTDSVSGTTVATERWQFAVGANTASSQTIIGTGPTKGDTLSIVFTNLDTAGAAVAFSYAINENSRVYTRDDWRQMTTAAVTGFTNGNSDQAGNFLVNTSPSVPNGTTLSRIIPLYAGKVTFCFVCNSQPMTLSINSLDQSIAAGIGGTQIYQRLVAATTVINDFCTLPRSPCFVSFDNTGAAAGSVTFSLVVDEYLP